MTQGRLFERVADLYDDVRPDYPDELYAALEAAVGPLRGQRVLDVAAGPGLATRQLAARGAAVVAVDPGHDLLRRLRSVTAEVPVVEAVAERLPLRAATFDLATCATAWHWLHAAEVCGELRRVVRPGGHLALWWANHRHGDGVEWEDAQSEVFRRWDLGRGSRAVDSSGVGPREAAADLRERGFDVVVDTELNWSRTVDLDTHLRVLRTHSDNLVLGERVEELIAEVARALAKWPVVTERLSGPLVIARIA